jgi:hypothetical protein
MSEPNPNPEPPPQAIAPGAPPTTAPPTGITEGAPSQPAQAPPAPTTPEPPASNYTWIFFFVFLVVASVGVTVLMIWFNLSIQLKREELDAARKLWEQKGPRNYEMVYTKQINNDDRKTLFAVKVRNGKVEDVLMNGKELEREKERDPRQYHSMDAIFRDIERFMDIDQKKDAPKVYVIANFDPDTGAVLRYIRRVMGSTERVELNVKVEPAGK